MSAIIIPALAVGGVYLLYDSMTKKEKKIYRSDTSSSRSRNKFRTLSSSSSSNSKSHTRKHKNNKKNKKPSSHSSSFKDINIRKNITKKNKEEKMRTIYVYYTYGSNKNKKWHYKSLPGGWGLKHKTDITKSSIKYSKLNTFTGPKKNRDALRKYLEKAFEYLKKKNIVKYYKITNEKIA
jgi:hypothetical protein